MGKKSRKKREDRARGVRHFTVVWNLPDQPKLDLKPDYEEPYGYTMLRELVAQEDIPAFLSIKEHIISYEHTINYTKYRLVPLRTKRFIYREAISSRLMINSFLADVAGYTDEDVLQLYLRERMAKYIRAQWRVVYDSYGSFANYISERKKDQKLLRSSSSMLQSEVQMHKLMLNEVIGIFNERKKVNEVSGYDENGTFHNIRLI